MQSERIEKRFGSNDSDIWSFSSAIVKEERILDVCSSTFVSSRCATAEPCPLTFDSKNLRWKQLRQYNFVLGLAMILLKAPCGSDCRILQASCTSNGGMRRNVRFVPTDKQAIGVGKEIFRRFEDHSGTLQ
jgi:hypothetical protein